MANDTAITPNRHTVLELDPTFVTIPLRPAWNVRRSRGQIHPGSVFGIPSVNIHFIPGLGWGLMDAPAERPSVLDTDVGGHVVTPAEVTAPANIGSINTNPLPPILILPGMTNP